MGDIWRYEVNDSVNVDVLQKLLNRCFYLFRDDCTSLYAHVAHGKPDFCSIPLEQNSLS